MSLPFRLLIIGLVLATTVSLLLFYSKTKDITVKKTDTEKFNKKLEHFNLLDDIAFEALNDIDTLSKEEKQELFKETILNDWTECVNLMDEAASLTVNEEQEAVRKKLLQYAKLRVEQTLLRMKMNEENNKNYEQRIDSFQQEIIIVQDAVKEMYKEQQSMNSARQL
jgi:hypothetical protein